MRIKAQTETDARLRAAFEAGCDHYSERPDDDLVTIYREASRRYGAAIPLTRNHGKPEMMEFAYGYSVCRGRADEKRREQA